MYTPSRVSRAKTRAPKDIQTEITIIRAGKVSYEAEKGNGHQIRSVGFLSRAKGISQISERKGEGELKVGDLVRGVGHMKSNGGKRTEGMSRFPYEGSGMRFCLRRCKQKKRKTPPESKKNTASEISENPPARARL
ncbi:hypothetical protein ACLOJK_033189 [Asimina triloba]